MRSGSVAGANKQTMTQDNELLRRYLDGSQDAFAELVHSHIGMVHGSAVRMLSGDTHLADEVTQTVFTSLARKSASLVSHRSLVGWLYLSTHHEAAKAVRSEQRRRVREQKAHAMQQIESEGPATPEWEALRPILDDTLRQLKDADREALLMRFFEARSLAEVGRGLGVNENAARMRVDRALERLRDRLARRGLASSAAALGTVLVAQTPAVVPLPLVTAVAGSALASVPAGAGGAAIFFMSMTKLQMGIAAALAVTGGVALFSEVRSSAALHSDNAALTAAAGMLPSDHESTFAGSVSSSSASKADEVGLPQLRAEEAILQRKLAERTRGSEDAAGPATEQVFDMKQLDKQPVSTRRVQPKYPVELRATGISGEALLSFTVGDQGRVQDIKIERATNGAFGEASRAALNQWEFTPGEKDGKTVKVRIQVPFVFEMQRDKDGNWF